MNVKVNDVYFILYFLLLLTNVFSFFLFASRNANSTKIENFLNLSRHNIQTLKVATKIESQFIFILANTWHNCKNSRPRLFIGDHQRSQFWRYDGPMTVYDYDYVSIYSLAGEIKSIRLLYWLFVFLCPSTFYLNKEKSSIITHFLFTLFFIRQMIHHLSSARLNYI